MESNRTDDNISAEQCASTSSFSRDHQESVHQKNGTDFVDNVQLHCKSIMERMEVIKQSVNVIGEDKDSVDSSENNPFVNDTSPESTNDVHGQKSSAIDPQEQVQKIQKRVERIVELVRSTAQKAESVNVRPDSSHRNKSSGNTKFNSTSSSREGEVNVGATSSEREALIDENESDCCALIKRSDDEKKLQVQEPIAETMIDKQIANETLDRKCDSVAETAALTLSHSKQKGLKKLSNGNSICGYVKLPPCSTELSSRDKDPYREMAKTVVQDVFARIGCHESFVRRASWANEPSSSSRDLGTILMAYSFTEPYEKFTISKQDSSGLDTPGETKTDGIASIVPETTDTETEETGAETLNCSTDQSKTASLVTSRDVRSRKRISFKSGQKKWAGLKKRRKSFIARKEARKMLNLQKSSDETAGYSKAESEFANGACQPVDERCQTAVDEDKLTPLKEFIVLGGAKTKDGEDIVVLNPSKIPSKREFTGRKEYNEIMECLFLYVQKFTEEKVKTEKFVVTVHAVTQRRSRLRSRKWATELYKFLKDRYQNRLTRCVFYKPSFKLRALVILSWPFFSNCMKEKIFLVRSRRDFAKAQGLESDAVTQETTT
ncbi:uncharacterized protein LOC144637168 [Oculina patagonica]